MKLEEKIDASYEGENEDERVKWWFHLLSVSGMTEWTVALTCPLVMSFLVAPVLHEAVR